jgi:hypothetical protein
VIGLYGFFLDDGFDHRIDNRERSEVFKQFAAVHNRYVRGVRKRIERVLVYKNTVDAAFQKHLEAGIDVAAFEVADLLELLEVDAHLDVIVVAFQYYFFYRYNKREEDRKKYDR